MREVWRKWAEGEEIMKHIPDEYRNWKTKDYKKELRRILILNGYQDMKSEKSNVLTKKGKDMRKTFTFGLRSFTLRQEESDGEWSSVTYPYNYEHCVLNSMIVWCG